MGSPALLAKTEFLVREAPGRRGRGQKGRWPFRLRRLVAQEHESGAGPDTAKPIRSMGKQVKYDSSCTHFLCTTFLLKLSNLPDLTDLAAAIQHLARVPGVSVNQLAQEMTTAGLASNQPQLARPNQVSGSGKKLKHLAGRAGCDVSRCGLFDEEAKCV